MRVVRTQRRYLDRRRRNEKFGHLRHHTPIESARADHKRTGQDESSRNCSRFDRRLPLNAVRAEGTPVTNQIVPELSAPAEAASLDFRLDLHAVSSTSCECHACDWLVSTRRSQAPRSTHPPTAGHACAVPLGPRLDAGCPGECVSFPAAIERTPSSIRPVH
jgi:hypothetical protein